MDQVYDFLMGTPPRGAVLEETLRKAGDEATPEQREDLAVLVDQTPDFNEDEAKKRVARRQRLVDRLKREGEEKPGS